VARQRLFLARRRKRRFARRTKSTPIEEKKMGNILKHTTVALVAAAGVHLAVAGQVQLLPGQIMVKPKSGTEHRAFADELKNYDAAIVDKIPQLNLHIVRLPEHALSAALNGLRHNPNIEFAEPDAFLAPDAVPNDPYYGSEWHLTNIKASAAWNSTVGSSSVIIAILDTGVDSSHPDLAGKLVAGWNCYDNNSNTSDVYGHGTAVAGTAAAASNNGLGMAGVAWNCRIMPVRISDSTGYAMYSTVAKGLTWAADNGARVANISYAASSSTAVKSAAQYFQGKGGVVAVSSGNEGAFSTEVDNPYVLTVSATDSADIVASWSNTGNHIDLAAPGVSILTTTRGGGYAYWNGTSFSAPVVAGVAALVISAKPSLTGPDVQKIVKTATDDIGSAGFDTSSGTGRVNAEKAVALALATTPTPVTQPTPVPTSDTTAPTVTITSPANGGTIPSTGGISVTVNAADNVAVVKMELYADNKLVSSATSAPFTTKWNTKKLAAGAHSLKVKAYDAAGNSCISSSVTVYSK
jgi:thermitase